MDLQPLNGICYAGDTKAITSCGAVALEELSKKPLLDFLTPWGFKPGYVVSRGLHRCRTITLKRIPNQSVYHPFSPTVRVAPTSHGYVEGDKLNSSLAFYKTDFDQGFIHGMIHRYGVPYEPYYGHNNIRKFSYGYRIKKKQIQTLLPILNARLNRECVIDSMSNTDLFVRTNLNCKHFPSPVSSEGYHSGFIHGFFSLPSRNSYPSNRFRLYFYDSLDHSLSNYILGHACFAGWLINPSFNHERYQVFFEVLFDPYFIINKTEIEAKETETFSPVIEDFPSFIAYPGFSLLCSPKPIVLHKNFIHFCVAEDTLIHTTDGPQQVKHLISKKFKGISQALDRYPTKKPGFFSPCQKELYEVTTEEGFKIKATLDQEFRTAYDPNLPLFSVSQWVKLSELKVGDSVQLSTHLPHSWSGPSTFSHGWLLTSLMFHGTLDPINGSSLTGKGTLHFKDYDSNFFLPLARKIATYSLPYRSTHENARVVNSITDGSFYSVAKKFSLSLKPFFISDEIEFTSNDFYKGFLQGLMDFTANLENENKIIISSPNFTIRNYKTIQRMFLRIGIKTILNKLSLSMDKANLINFLSQTGFTHPEVIKRFKHLVPNWDYQLAGEHTAKIKTINLIGRYKVYTAYLPTFDGNGFLLRGLT